MMLKQALIFTIMVVVVNGRGIRNSKTTVNKYANSREYHPKDFKQRFDALYQRNLRQWLNTLYQPNYQYFTPNKPSTSKSFADASAPNIKYHFKVGIVDPRTVDKTNIVDSKPLLPSSVVNARKPIIRYPFRVGIVDPRTVRKPTSKYPKDDEPAPNIKYRF